MMRYQFRFTSLMMQAYQLIVSYSLGPTSNTSQGEFWEEKNMTDYLSNVIGHHTDSYHTVI